MKKRRSVPPSRAKYEASHLTVSVRVSRDLYDQLNELRDMAGVSMADVFRVGLEKLEALQREYPTLPKSFPEWRALGAGESYPL